MKSPLAQLLIKASTGLWALQKLCGRKNTGQAGDVSDCLGLARHGANR